MSEPIIRVEGLGKRYRLRQQAAGYRVLRDVFADGARRLAGRRPAAPPAEEFWALKDVSFDVAPGEVVGVIGRNGAGKSTLLKVLSRITEPTAGRVTLDGRVASLLEVGTGFHPELTGRENIYLNGSILGMTRAEVRRKFDEIVAFSEVEQFLDTPVKRYSSGMYVRLAFAVAAHLEPEILIVDEVLAVGDAGFQKKCLGKMGQVAKGGRTVLFVSHNMGAVATLCESGILLTGGRLAVKGPIREVMAAYSAEVMGAANDDVVQAKQRVCGNGNVRLTHARLRTTNGDDRREYTVGEPVELELVYHANQSVTGSGWVLVTARDGTVLCSGLMRDNHPPAMLSGTGRLVVRLDEFGLLPGVYSITAGLFNTIGEIEDWCENIASLQVLSHNYSGQGFDGRLGVLSRLLAWKHLPE